VCGLPGLPEPPGDAGIYIQLGGEMRKTVPIKQDGRVVGEAVVEDGPKGVRVVSTRIDDPVLLETLYADQQTRLSYNIPFMTLKKEK
jgi:hypothetical protein